MTRPRPHPSNRTQAQIEKQGEEVRKVKADKADAAAVKAAVDKLLALKVCWVCALACVR